MKDQNPGPAQTYEGDVLDLLHASESVQGAVKSQDYQGLQQLNVLLSQKH